MNIKQWLESLIANLPSERTIELRGGPAHVQGKRLTLSSRTRALNIPVMGPGGFGQVTYRPTGEYVTEHVEIWRP